MSEAAATGQNWAGTFGLLASLIDGFASGSSQSKQIEAQNKANKAAWEAAAQQTRDQLTIAYNRTLTGLQEINRDKIAAQQAAEIAGAEATGTAEVSAAQLGITGKRGSTAAASVERKVANAKSDAVINAKIESVNAVNYYSDVAKTAVNNLNSQSPTAINNPGILGTVTSTITSGFSYYNKLSDAQKSDVSSNLKQVADTAQSALKFE